MSQATADLEELAALYRRTWRLVWAALGRAGITRDAERRELLQDVFLVAHIKWATCEHGAREAWVMAIAKHVARDYRKLKRVREEQPMSAPDALPEHAARGPSPEDVAHARQEYHALMNAIGADDRVVFEMHEVEGFEVPEIARALSIAEGTARTRLRRARLGVEAAVSRARARDARAMTGLGLPATLLFGRGAWSEAGRVFDDAPPDLSSELWARVERAIVRHAAVGLTASAASVGVVAKMSAASFTSGLLVGGGAVAIVAITARLLGAPPPVQPIAVASARDATPAVVASAPEAAIVIATATASETAPPVVAVRTSAAAAHAASAIVPGIDPEEVRLFQQALAASRSGDLAAAVSALDEHARRFPRGALARDRERMRASVAEARAKTAPAPGGAHDAGASRRLFGTDD